MSLEKKIAELTVAINTLTETILKSDIGLLIKEQAEQIEAAVEEHAPAKLKTEPKGEKAEPEQTNDDAPTVDEIKSLCMRLVRADKTKKQPILDALGAYGAKTVDKVPSDKLGELKTKLEAL